jgi:hypothetical protein
VVECLILLLNLEELQQPLMTRHCLLELSKVLLFVDQLPLHQEFYELLMDEQVLVPLVLLAIVVRLLLL